MQRAGAARPRLDSRRQQRLIFRYQGLDGIARRTDIHFDPDAATG